MDDAFDRAIPHLKTVCMSEMNSSNHSAELSNIDTSRNLAKTKWTGGCGCVREDNIWFLVEQFIQIFNRRHVTLDRCKLHGLIFFIFIFLILCLS